MNELFETNYYRLIKLINEHNVSISGQTFCPLSQSDISKALNISRPVTSRMLDELEVGGYIKKLSRSKTQLTQKGMDVIRALQKI